MKQVIERIFKRTTEYSHPSQATTIANSLELLSSGIYTEEERFVFELLQNAVDSYDEKVGELRIKIVVDKRQLIFMHNGKAFSERDLEGLCDIGNGNKMSDAKKIGYKGIGFKSVFMHSKRVTVITDGTCFRFDQEVCKELAAKRGEEYKDVKMPWQIIPITTEIPLDIEYDTYNVVTVLEVLNTEKLLNKIEKLLSDARFLLFLNVDNLRVSLFDIETEILSLSKTQKGNILTLSKNNVAQSHWLMYAKEVEIPSEVKEDLIHDIKTPAKLKDSESVEISFAIALDDAGNIVPLKNAVVYTYLPTSFSFGFEFVVNANFITDAGRQQLIKDCEWNKFIFSQIPCLFLNWIKDTVAPNYKDWYKVLLPEKKGSDELSIAYSSKMTSAIRTIPFVRAISGNQCLLANIVFDQYAFHMSLPNNVFDSFAKHVFNISNASNSVILSDCGQYLVRYGINVLSKSTIQNFLEESTSYLGTLEISKIYHFFKWLNEASELRDSTFDKVISYAKILPCEDGRLHEAINAFFPSEFKNENEIAEDAIVLRPFFAKNISSKLKSWLKELGVQEMSNLSVIDKVLCEDGYITAENAVNVLRFIFNCNRKENIFSNISESRLANIKVLTTKGDVKFASQLYLSDIYNPYCKIQRGYYEDIFVSEKYVTSQDDITEWALFLKKLGVCDDIKLTKVKYGDGTWVMSNYTIRRNIYIAKDSEYNTAWDGRKYHLGCAGGICIYALTSIFLQPTNQCTKIPTVDFYSNVWGRIFSQPMPGLRDDYIFGETGCGYTKSAYLSERKYLNMTFLEWMTINFPLIPASDGQLHKINDVLPNTTGNMDVFGKYFPVITVNGEITRQWQEHLAFKKELYLTDYLEILSKIGSDDYKEQINENRDRICRIYDRIADAGYDLAEGSSDFNVLRNWGKTNKILSSNNKFEFPCDLCLISSRLSGVELDNMVYHRKNQENERFALFMIALGVNMITDHRVEGLDAAISQDSIKDSLMEKADFFTALKFNGEVSEEEWDKSNIKMKEAISNINFFNVPFISVIYGKQSIEKPVYVYDKKLYFVGKYGLATQELLHEDIVRLIGLHNNDRSTFLTLIRMNNFDEMIEYLKFKGYDTQYISNTQLPEIVEPSQSASIQGEDAPCGELTAEHKRAALNEAKDAILEQLSMDGFDISNYHWNEWTHIDGVKKDGIEYPLVIRSNKYERNTIISAPDWNQLMKPNAMFVVNTNSGIGTIKFKDLLKSRDKITIRFASDNIDVAARISKLAEVFAFFKGMQFDFESYVKPTISRWQSFMAPELETGEQASANTAIPLP